MIAKSEEDLNQTCPLFYLGDQVLNVVNKIKYLGHNIRNYLNDNDVQRQCCKLLEQTKMLACKFFNVYGVCVLSV